MLHDWPTPFDAVVTTVFLSAAIGVPALGYVAMVLDIRAYLRSLRRALVKVANYFPDLPVWFHQQTPRCIAAFGLSMPCGEEQLKAAYRRKVKQLHPDRGGDKRRFLLLQRYFEEALAFLAEQARNV